MNFLPASTRGSRGRAVVRIAGLVDLVFLLLAFFLVTSALLEGESSVAAALGVRGEGEVLVAPVQVEVVPGGWMVANRRIDTAASLREMLEALPKGPGIVVRAGPGVSAGEVVATVREARVAGVSRLTLETQP